MYTIRHEKGRGRLKRALTIEDMHRPCDAWGIGDYIACWRMLAHIVDHAPNNPEYREVLTSLRVRDLNRAALVFLKLHLEDVPQARELLSAADAGFVAQASPLVPSIVLDADPVGFERYIKMGVVI